MTRIVEYHPEVSDDLARLGNAEATRVLRVIEERIINGEPDKSGKPLRHALSGCRRIRTGNTRIIYQIDGHNIKVLIIAVGPRRNKEVYDAVKKRTPKIKST